MGDIKGDARSLDYSSCFFLGGEQSAQSFSLLSACGF